MRRACVIVVVAALLAAPEDEGTFTVLTYNVHGLPDLITGDDTLARQQAIAPGLERFDVVGLQEDFMDEGHARLVGPATHGTRLRFDAALDGRVYGSGLTLLARPRATRHEVEHFREFHGVLDAGSDGLASKGWLMARLELAPGVEVDVYDSHLDAARSAGDQAARASQVEQLIAAMAGVSAGRAVVFLGDTNLGDRGRDRETLARWLATSGLTCACLASRETCCGRIDRIFYRSGAGVTLEGEGWGVAPGFVDAQGAQLSDHEPLQATLRWRREPL